MTIEEPIFHLAAREEWEAARRAAVYTGSTRGASLDDVGFVHCSFAAQVEPVANLVFADFDGDLVLLEIEPALVAAEIRVEDVAGAGEAFPHVYGSLPVTAVRAVHRLQRTDGQWCADLGGS